jgi:hypothetical protein
MTMGAEAPMRPLPMPDELTEPFWAAVRDHRLDIQRCAACARWNHAPTLQCPACGSDALRFETVSGRASLYSWTILHDAPAPGFAGLLPLIVAIVALEEGPLMVANLSGTGEEALRLGLKLEARFEDVGADCTLPCFVPAEG